MEKKFKIHFIDDFVSKLGAKGEPNAIWWNIIGFGLVGAFLFGFGIYYGGILKDKLAGLLLALFGFGFARISHNDLIGKRIRNRANLNAILIVISMIGSTMDLWSMPVTHRLVFGWTAITSIELLVLDKEALKSKLS